ncbi:DUF1513 domain-containing protein [Rhodobacterales bacterium HKCCE4037]|nr:DUF1513 domain-containing protein [Rhodobacterales bacterium HKCCE4037]
MKRRSVLVGLGAAALSPSLSWADAQSPSFLSAARAVDGSYHLCGLSDGGAVLFSIPLPDRGHAAAAHPVRPEAVAFARRPGRFALIVDCATGQEAHRLTPPPDRHFYGHGVFSADGSMLFTTENDLDTLDGRIGLWDAANGYARIGDMPSGGVGPHDIERLPGTDTLVIANGGIATHPESGRTPLNLATMRPNLAYLGPDGEMLEVVELDTALRFNSIRHLDVRPDGLVAAGMQWNGSEAEHPPLILTHRMGETAQLLEAPAQSQRKMIGYVGSITFQSGGAQVAVTSPRGGLMQVFDAETGAFLSDIALEDACGISTLSSGQSLITSGVGSIWGYDAGALTQLGQTSWAWDNHLIAI